MAKAAFSSAGETMQLRDGRALGYLETGDPGGRALFYFHGAPGSRLEGLLFEGRNKQLGIRMIAPERPGYGLSDVHRSRTYLDWAKDVGELADHLGIDRFAVLGYSSGGPYAAAVAHELPERVTVAGIVAGEGPYARGDFPRTVLSGDTFSGSMLNKVLILGARRAPWLMRGVWSAVRVFVLRDPIAFLKSTTDAKMPEHDVEFFSRDDVGDTLAEAFRQGSLAATQDHNIERRPWPFELEGIQQTPVLVFHGERDTTVDPAIAEYVCSRIPSCGGPTLYPGEGHSVVHYRYEEIIRGMLEAGA